MLDSKFFFTLVGLTIAVIAICNTSFTPYINETFIPGSRTVRVEQEVHPGGLGSCQGQGIPTNYNNLGFIQRPNFQASLSPRFSNVNYGANIRYNMPSYKNQGVPCDAMSLGNMAKEGYSHNLENTVSGSGGVIKNGSCNESSYTSAMNKLYNDSPFPVPNDMLPTSDMTQAVLGSDGNVTNNIVYDRYIYANQKSNLRSQGDPIRGDLPIKPHAKSQWFNVSVTPHIDLQMGALNVMGGIDNSSNRALSELMYASSGNSRSSLGGVDMTGDFSMMTGAGLGGKGRDVQIASFI